MSPQFMYCFPVYQIYGDNHPFSFVFISLIPHNWPPLFVKENLKTIAADCVYENIRRFDYEIIRR
jgi:hypothetical protein